MLYTISILLNDYENSRAENPDLRLGQYFINKYIKDGSTVPAELWQADLETAQEIISKILRDWQYLDDTPMEVD